MTDLVERYLATVERRLPETTAKDIVAELREALEATLDAKAAELGRCPSTDEVADVLKAFGAPAVVAARYEGRMHLIGPVLYPWFWPAQRAAIGITVAIFVVLAAATFAVAIWIWLRVPDTPKPAETQGFAAQWAGVRRVSSSTRRRAVMKAL